MTDGDLELRVAWQRHVGTDRPADRWYESIVARHHEVHRHYHDLRHVRWVVRHVGELADGRPVGDLGAVVAAAFFHDVIYDPTRSDNEAASAQLAEGALRGLRWADERIDQVATLIRGTAHHRVDDTTTIDTAVLYAADLGVLAADPAGYSDYVRNVRREYHQVTDAAWAEGRAAVLRSFLDRRSIYAPVLGLDGWELRARANLTAELGTLVP
jgi:predicted metal-dependent HD superfamily phosphohydrolase